MGQGLFTKVRKIVADTFGILSNNVKISATDTNKVPIPLPQPLHLEQT